MCDCWGEIALQAIFFSVIWRNKSNLPPFNEKILKYRLRQLAIWRISRGYQRVPLCPFWWTKYLRGAAAPPPLRTPLISDNTWWCIVNSLAVSQIRVADIPPQYTTRDFLDSLGKKETEKARIELQEKFGNVKVTFTYDGRARKINLDSIIAGTLWEMLLSSRCKEH